MPLSAGERLGSYEILAAIGAGGMGEVYRARDSKLKRDVALKVLPEAFARDPDRMARFQREAEVLASLNHPNIAAIYGVEDRALVMELVEGEHLNGPLPLDTALNYARQIAEALEYAHERGVIHRDLKPANVKVTPQGVVKLLDFGLAKAIAPDQPPEARTENSPTLTMGAMGQTVAGVILGTAAYMSPEQARGKPADKRSDIWAFGALLYELLTGKRAFHGETTTDILASVVKEDPSMDAIPPQVRPLIARCLRKDPRQRWQAIGDVRVMLEEGLSASPAVVPAVPVRAAEVPWIAAAVMTILASVALWAPWRSPPPAEVVRFDIQPPDSAGAPAPVLPLLSPDGRRVAFITGSSSADSKVWIRSLDTLEPRPLAGTEGGFLAAWSPDNRSVIFAIQRPSNQIRKIDVSGGPPQPLCEIPAARGRGGPGRGGGPPSAAWNREGVIIFYPGRPGGLLRVSQAGGACTPLTAIDTSRGETVHEFPSFLPDGHHFLYQRSSTRPENSGIYVGSLDAKPEQQDLKRILAADSRAIYSSGYLLFLRQGTLMAQAFNPSRAELSGEALPVAEKVGEGRIGGLFSATEAGTLAYRTGPAGGDGARLTWFDREGKIVGTAGDLGEYTNPVLSPDGSRVAFTRTETPANSTTPNTDIWLYDFVRGISSRFTSDPATDTAPQWSPDGKYIVFNSDRGGSYDLYRKATSGTEQEELLYKSPERKTPTDWSRDGRFVLYHSVGDSKTGSDIWYLPLGPDGSPGKPVPYLNTEFTEAFARFSPDGRYIVYQSNANGANAIYVRTFPNPKGGLWPIAPGGGFSGPRWSRDGKELLYIAGINNVMAVDVTTSPVFKPGIPKALFQFPLGGGQINNSFDVGTDRQKFIRPMPGALLNTDAPSPITVVLNWPTALKK